MTTQLKQIIAIEKGVKTRSERYITEAYKNLQKPHLFDGLNKTYEKSDEEGEDFPQERQLVQLRVRDTLQDVAEQMTEYMDTVATKDLANCNAKADVVVDGAVLLTSVPATHLLFLEKKLTDLNTVADNLPVLDSAYDWRLDEASGTYKSNAVATTKNRKVAKPITLSEPTKEHPAQVQLIQVDEKIGTWTTVKQSGAVTADRKKELQKRAQTLLKAVKFAREAANSVEAPTKEVGHAIFDYLLK